MPAHAYNAGMKKAAHLLALLCLAAATTVASAQFAPPRQDRDDRRPPREMRDSAPEQREQWREERREHREQWRQMSPEERHQLRRDIRDAGRDLYPHRRPRGD